MTATARWDDRICEANIAGSARCRCSPGRGDGRDDGRPMTRALVVGLGSIGRRHARVLDDLGCEVAVVSRRSPSEGPHRMFGGVAVAVAEHRPEYVVLARETARHAADVGELAATGFGGAVLVEKPLTATPAHLPLSSFSRVAVAYNLRFHPVLASLRSAMVGQDVATVTAHAGQHLSTWRPGTDYRQGYSADPAAGGGVLRDLSHELDYLQWLFGPPVRLAAAGGQSGMLEVASDDVWGVLLELERAPLVSLQLDYLDRVGQRRLVVTSRDHTWVADLVANRLQLDGAEVPTVGEQDTYRAQHVAMLSDEGDDRLCSAADGAAVVRLVMSIETAARDRRWVTP